MKFVRYGLYAAGGLLLVFAGLVGYIAATFDPNAYKADIVRVVHEQTGRTLTISGDIGLTLFPKIGARLGPTSLSERDANVEFAGVDDVRVALALLPLLSQKVVVDEIVIEGLRAQIVKHADGRMNVDDLAGSAKSGDQDEPDTDSEAATGSSPAIDLNVEGVRIVNGSFGYADEQVGAHYTVSEFNIQTGRIAAGVPIPFDYRARVQSDQPKLDLRTEMSGVLNADTTAQVFTISTLKVNVQGVLATLSELAMSVTLEEIESRPPSQFLGVQSLALKATGAMNKDRFNVDVSAPRLVLEKQAVSVENLVATLGGQFSGTELTEAQFSIPVLAVNLENQHIDLTGVGAFASGKQSENTFQLKLDAPRLAITPQSATGEAVVATVKATGPDLRADATIRLAAVAGSAAALNISEFALELDAQQADNSVKGKLSTPLIGDFGKQHFRLPKIIGKFDVTSPALPMKSTSVPLSGDVDADIGQERIGVNLNVRFDGSNIGSMIALSEFANPMIRFDTVIDKLNVDRYKPESTADEEPAGKEQDGGESRIDLSPLKSLNLDGKLRIGELIASNVKLSDVRVTVKAKDGQVEINPLLANLYGGSIRGAITADANTNQFKFKQSLSAITVGPLLKDALDQDLLDGRGSVDLDLNAQGDTMGALMKSLTGDAGMALKDGALKGINLAQSLRNAGDRLSLKRDTETDTSKSEKTDFSDLKASFRIDNGQATNQDLALSSPFLRLNGAGKLNLVEGSLDYLAKTSLVASAEGQGGKGLADVAGLTVPVRITGPLTALKYKLQFADAVQDQTKQQLKAQQAEVKQQLQAKEEAVKSKLESQLKDKLLGDESTAAEPAKTDVAPAANPKEEVKNRLKKLLR